MAISTSLDLIILPRVTAMSLSALLGRMVSLAAEEKLPAALKPRVAKLEAVQAELTITLASRPGKVPVDEVKSTEADAIEDKAVKALIGFLTSTAALPTKAGDQAAIILGDVFADDLSWLNGKFDEEWGEVETRLAKIDSTHAKSIASLGGTAFLDNLRAAHKVYGEVLGITVARPEKAAAPDVRRVASSALDQLRRYVAVVIGMAANADADPELGVLAARLLAPLDEVRAKAAARNRGKAGDGEVIEPEPTPPMPKPT